MDVEGIRLMMPFDLLVRTNVDGVPTSDYYRYRVFYLEILFRCDRMRELSYRKYKSVYMKVAENLYNTVKSNLNSAAFAQAGNSNKPPNDIKTSVLDYPIRPVEYDEQDSYGVINSLNTCGLVKVALMDTKENIAAITSFLNDHQQKVTYVQGDGDYFFTTTRGWVIPPVRSNYVEKRLKVLISSGILINWKVVYNLWRPIKLLGHYANWTGAKVEAVSRLDFCSKVTTGFYICGICFRISVIVLIAEILRHV
ncbi:hypothetical protein Fcan01_16443 [Folsomia candida]|uniref:Uncharacterized protein n=1 Tax=Folsomia candida TaxID=158441 RepID=A0A226DVH4_FOLCA|nr:hypothetical protein Fcan01_16443 [Folsomia candida]